MTRISISRAWDESRARLARDGKLFVAVAAALIVLPSTIAGLVAGPVQPGEGMSDLQAGIAIVNSLIGQIGLLALARLALDPPVQVGEAIRHGTRRLFTYLAAFLVWVLPFAVLMVVVGGPALENPTSPPPGSSLGLTAILIVMLPIATRLLLVGAVTVAEPVGPIGALKRSWAMTRGQLWRLLGFLLLIVLLLVVVLTVSDLVGNVVAKLLLGDAEPMTVGRLFISLVNAVAEAMVTGLFAVMLARIYAQLAARTVSVPATAD